MARRGAYLGGSTIIKANVPRSKKKKSVVIGALEQAAEAFRANPPPMFPMSPTKPRKRKPRS